MLGLIIASCSKTKDVSSSLDRVDLLFQQVKNDSNYHAYYNIIWETTSLFADNARNNLQLKDTTILKDHEISLKEKFNQLGYNNYPTVESNGFKIIKLSNYLWTKYPVFKELKDDELVKLSNLSFSYYKPIKNQIK